MRMLYCVLLLSALWWLTFGVLGNISGFVMGLQPTWNRKLVHKTAIKPKLLLVVFVCFVSNAITKQITDKNARVLGCLRLWDCFALNGSSRLILMVLVCGDFDVCVLRETSNITLDKFIWKPNSFRRKDQAGPLSQAYDSRNFKVRIPTKHSLNRLIFRSGLT